MQTSFPKPESQFIKASDFQDRELALTYVGWDRKANEDVYDKNNVLKRSWKEGLKYTLRYSYPEIAKDEAGEPILNKNGEAFKNRNWNPDYPHGYTIVYHFENGQVHESGSLPLWNRFCEADPQPGDVLLIRRTGKDKETIWSVRKKAKDLPVIDIAKTPDDLDIAAHEAGADVPF